MKACLDSFSLNVSVSPQVNADFLCDTIGEINHDKTKETIFSIERLASSFAADAGAGILFASSLLTPTSWQTNRAAVGKTEKTFSFYPNPNSTRRKVKRQQIRGKHFWMKTLGDIVKAIVACFAIQS
ncbi:hypothetical protein N9Y89_01735 [bacterium]|nr:hypothetical protein [bacterium]